MSTKNTENADHKCIHREEEKEKGGKEGEGEKEHSICELILNVIFICSSSSSFFYLTFFVLPNTDERSKGAVSSSTFGLTL